MLLWVEVYVIKFIDHFLYYQNNHLHSQENYSIRLQKNPPNSIIYSHSQYSTVHIEIHVLKCTCTSKSKPKLKMCIVSQYSTTYM